MREFFFFLLQGLSREMFEKNLIMHRKKIYFMMPYIFFKGLFWYICV